MLNRNNPAFSATERKRHFKAHELQTWFEMLRRCFEAAAENAGETKQFRFDLDGQTVALNFAGDALFAPLTKGLAHLARGSKEKPDLSFFVWDEFSTKQSLPVLVDVLVKCAFQAPWLVRRGERSELFDFTDEQIFTSLYGETILTSLDSSRNAAIYYSSGLNSIPYYEIGAPFRMPLGWHFSTAKRQILHSGAVGFATGGVLLAGKGGSGKSTTALRCLDSPLFYAGDDYTLVSIEANQVVAHSLFNTAKVKTGDDLARFANLNLQPANREKIASHDEKPMMFLADRKPEKLIASLPLKSIVFPRFIQGEATKIVPVAKASAFKSLVNSNIMQTPHIDKTSMRMIADLTGRLPAYLLIFGESQNDLHESILKILAENS